MTVRARALLVASLALSAASLGSGSARADDSNFRPYIVGSRAAGMGGAFTALADDGSGPFYNPGGLAFVKRSQLSLAGSVYGIVSGTFTDALGPGHDFNFSDLNTLPTATAGVWKVRDSGPEGSSDVLALSIFVPDAVNEDDRDTLLSQQNAFFLVNQTQTVWGGLTYAHRMGRVGLGVSGFLLYGTQTTQLDATLASSNTQFATVTYRSDESSYGVVGAVGVRWDVSDAFRLGVSAYSPEVGGGSRRLFLRAAAGTGTASAIEVLNVDGLHSSPTLPLRVQGGVAYTSGPFTLAADIIWLAPREVVDDAGTVVQNVPLENHVVRNGVVNGSLGGEYLLGESFPLRAGFFTDFAASNATSATSDVANSSHVNRFGGTLSIGYLTEHTATNLGVNLSGGSGNDLVPSDITTLNFTSKVTSSSQLFAYLFLGTSYEF